MLSDCVAAPLCAPSQNVERTSLILQLISDKSSGVIGASYCEFGNSKVACYVLCPRALTKSSSTAPSVDFGILECEVSTECPILDETSRSGLDKASYDKKLSQWTQQALNSAILLQYYPKQLITVSVVVLQSSSYDYAAAVNAGTLALADASVHLIDLPCSATISKANSDESNPTSNYLSRFTFAELPALQKTTNIAVEGRMEARMLRICQEELHASCLHIRSIMDTCLKAKQLRS